MPPNRNARGAETPAEPSEGEAAYAETLCRPTVSSINIGHPESLRIYMRFLYVRFCFRLENICREWQISRVFRVANGRFDLICVVLPCAEPPWGRRNSHKGIPMLDLILVALGLGFFAATIAYAFACERL